MTLQSSQVALVIDDDPMVGEFVRRALPDWTIHVAYNGADGVAFVRAHAEALRLIILDHRMPHDGVLVARQIREIHRTLCIVPFSSAEEKSAAFAELGTAPLIAKRLALTEAGFRAALLAAADAPPSPLPRWAVLDDLHERAGASEAAVIQQRRLWRTVAILASTRSAAQMLQLAAQAVGASVVTTSTTPGTLALFLHAAPAEVLLADGPHQRAALQLGAQQGLPVIVVALTVVGAYTADAAAEAVLIDSDERELAAALAAVVSGERYRDSRLDVPPAAVGLSERERQLLPLLLRGYSTEEIADILASSGEGALAEATIRRYRGHLLDKFAVRSLAELGDRLAGWFADPAELR